MTRIRVPNPYNRQDEGDPERDLEQWHREATQTRTYIREFPTIAEIERTITVVRDNDKYENIARKHGQVAPGDVQLNDHEMASLVKEADHSFSEKGMRIVLASIGLSAFLQGFVQSSQNGANLFEHLWGIDRSEPDQAKRRVGIANAVVYWSAALMYAPNAFLLFFLLECPLFIDVYEI
jgi:hypothetical protein